MTRCRAGADSADNVRNGAVIMTGMSSGTDACLRRRQRAAIVPRRPDSVKNTGPRRNISGCFGAAVQLGRFRSSSKLDLDRYRHSCFPAHRGRRARHKPVPP